MPDISSSNGKLSPVVHDTVAPVSGAGQGKEPVTPPTNVYLGTGLKQRWGLIDEQYLKELNNWSTAVKIYSEMRNHPVVGGVLEAIKSPLLAAPFEVHAASDSTEDKQAAAFLAKNIFEMPDMEWTEHVEEMLSLLDYGFAISEKVAFRSLIDNQYYLRTLMPVGQDTLDHWADPDELGNTKGFFQLDPNSYKISFAPSDKLLHFTYRARKRNPQGESILNSIYIPWYFSKNLEILEAIGVERDVGNFLRFILGPQYLSQTQIDELKTALEGMRIDETSYLILPNGSEVAPIGAGGKVHNVRDAIRDWHHLMRQRLFSDFLALGGGQQGTQSLAKELGSFFSLSLRSTQEKMLAVWNRQLVPWIFRWNGYLLDRYPRIEWGKPGAFSLQSLAQAMNTLIGAKILSVDLGVENQIRQELGLPPITEDQRKKNLETTAPKPFNSGGFGNSGKPNLPETNPSDNRDGDNKV
jgi:hypothetical protein